ncbi:hypothetical protein C8J57DRAFT_544429 [Mycena rebaudengoi]|nr:hypothetical protein C8J57DRAFT_544429 [Mycena rebaudengoi]
MHSTMAQFASRAILWLTWMIVEAEPHAQSMMSFLATYQNLKISQFGVVLSWSHHETPHASHTTSQAPHATPRRLFNSLNAEHTLSIWSQFHFGVGPIAKFW